MYTLQRTTVRLPNQLKDLSREYAAHHSYSFQEVMVMALEQFLRQETKEKAKKLVFHARSLGTPLDSITRDQTYAD
jgi:hypothetical protein